MQRFSCTTQIISGAGALEALAELGIRRLFIVTDPFFMGNGTARRLAQTARAEASAFFDQVAPDPDVELAAKGTAALREFQPDTLLALGGGSAMDCAKAMACFYGKKLRLIAVPTTSGSGSEVTDFAILTHNGVKHPLVDPALRPDVAILDSDLLTALPPSLIADAGFDVLSHALEAVATTGHGPFTDALARDAFRIVYTSLADSYAGKQGVRLDIHQAASMAGLAFTQAGLGVCHALSHSLGGAFHVPHGRLNAILLPAVVHYNAQAAGPAYAALARCAGMEGSAVSAAVRNLRNGLVRLRRELRLPATLAQAGIDPARLHRAMPEILTAALEDPCCKTNPRKADRDGLSALLAEVSGHG